MDFRYNRMKKIALFAALAVASAPAVAHAFAECPTSSPGCTELKGAGKSGGFFRVAFPTNWDGDLVIANHGFDLNDKHIRPHESCSHNSAIACVQDSDCGSGNFCNNISYMGLDEILMPKGKAVAAGTYHQSGWAPFGSAKDLKDIIKAVKKDATFGKQLKRVIITGFSGGGAVTGDAILKLKIDGAVPLCAAVGGGLPTWDVAMDIRLVYDFLCDGVSGAKFQSAPDVGEANSANSSNDSLAMATKVDACFGNLGIIPDDGHQDDRLATFLALTRFSGLDYGDGINLASAMGFATLGLGDFVKDPARLNGARIGLNDTLDYSTMGTDLVEAAALDAGIERLTAGPGRKTLTKASYPDFVKGKGAKVDYPVMMMAGAADWLVIPEFGNVFTTAMTAGSKAYTQTWINTFGHCVFTPEETTAVFNKFFDWMGPVGGPRGPQPTKQDVADECTSVEVGGIDGDTCNFNGTFVPGAIYDRIPERADWPPAAKKP